MGYTIRLTFKKGKSSKLVYFLNAPCFYEKKFDMELRELVGDFEVPKEVDFSKLFSLLDNTLKESIFTSKTDYVRTNYFNEFCNEMLNMTPSFTKLTAKCSNNLENIENPIDDSFPTVALWLRMVINTMVVFGTYSLIEELDNNKLLGNSDKNMWKFPVLKDGVKCFVSAS